MLIRNTANNQLWDTVKRNDVEAVRLALLSSDADINYVDAHDRGSLLGMACYLGHVEIVELFLSNPGVDVNVLGINGSTPLMWACYRSRSKIVSLLLNHPDIDIYRCLQDRIYLNNDVYWDKNSTALTIAYKFGGPELNRSIIKAFVKSLDDDLKAEFNKEYKFLENQKKIEGLALVIFKKLIESDGGLAGCERLIRQLNFILSPVCCCFYEHDMHYLIRDYRDSIAGMLKTRVEFILESERNIDFLEHEKDKIRLMLDSLLVVRQLERETYEPAITKSMIALFKNLSLNVKHIEALASDEFSFIFDILGGGSIVAPGMFFKLLEPLQGQEMVGRLRNFLNALTVEQRSLLKSVLFKTIQAMDGKEVLEHQERRLVAHLQNSFVSKEKRKTALFEIFRTGNRTKVDHDTGTWKDFSTLMNKGQHLKVGKQGKFKVVELEDGVSLDGSMNHKL